MTDTRTPEQRTRIMAAVKSRNTGPEIQLRRALYARGIRGWRCNYKRAAGRPDIAWPARKIAIFVDGAFWHGHPSRHKPGRSGEYWDRKIEQNVERDRRVDRELREDGWDVLRLWDFEIRKDLDGSVGRVVETLKRSQARRDVSESCPPGADDVGIARKPPLIPTTPSISRGSPS